jgi:hypothetical protein
MPRHTTPRHSTLRLKRTFLVLQANCALLATPLHATLKAHIPSLTSELRIARYTTPRHSTLRLKRTFLVLQANCASSLAHLSRLIAPLHNIFFFSLHRLLLGCREVMDVAKSYRTNNVFLFFGSDFKCDCAMLAVSFSCLSLLHLLAAMRAVSFSVSLIGG